MGWILFHIIFFIISHIHIECEKYLKIFCGILLVPQYNGMDLNIVTRSHIMSIEMCTQSILCWHRFGKESSEGKAYIQVLGCSSLCEVNICGYTMINLLSLVVVVWGLKSYKLAKWIKAQIISLCCTSTVEAT